MAVAGQVPIIPIVVENYWKIYALSEKRFDKGDIEIRGQLVDGFLIAFDLTTNKTVLPPIPTKGLTSSPEDITQLTDKVRNAMLDAMEEMVKRPDTAAGQSTVLRDGAEAMALYKPKKA